MGSRSHTQSPQPKGEFQQDYVWKIAQGVRDALRGKSNNVGDLTLAASATTTLLKDPLIGPESYIDFMPVTAHAAVAKGTLWVSARIAGQATLTHALTIDADKTFVYTVVG